MDSRCTVDSAEFAMQLMMNPMVCYLSRFRTVLAPVLPARLSPFARFPAAESRHAVCDA
jgi:hypothetical protein